MAGEAASIGFIRSHRVIYSIVSIWLSNLTSFLLGGVLVVIHPGPGLLAVAFMSLSDSGLLASRLSGYCPLPHLVYGAAESQAYILLWGLVAGIRLRLRGMSGAGPAVTWSTAVAGLKKLLPPSILCFLALAIVEVLEVYACA